MRWAPAVCLVVAVASGASCVDRGSGPQGKKIDPGYVRDNTLTTIPADIDHVDVTLGGKIRYLGTKLVAIDPKSPTTQLAPGGTIRVLHYWQVTQPIGPGWKLFRYMRGDKGSADFQNFGPTDMEIGLPPSKWQAGQIIQDAQDITLRPDWRSPTATLYVGLIADDGHQLGDRMITSPETGPAVADRAIVARTFEIDLAKAPPPLGTIYVPHAAGPITIDGVATEPGWSTAVMSPEFATADGSPDPVGKAVARMTWDEQNLYVFVQVTDTDIYSQYKTHDEPLWKQDVVEMFIDADSNRRGYVELQVNPNNVTFDSYFATTRAQPGDETWTSNMVTAVKVRGTADKAGDADQGWDVEIAIPLAAVKGRDDAMNVRIPPQVGDTWRLNVVRVDYRSSGGSPGVASWNRISYSDFHALNQMLNVVFADSTGSIKPQPGTGTIGAPVAPTPTTPGTAPTTPVPSSPGTTVAPPAPGTVVAPPAPGTPPAPSAPSTTPAPSTPPAPSTTPAPAPRAASPVPAPAPTAGSAAL